MPLIKPNDEIIDASLDEIAEVLISTGLDPDKIQKARRQMRAVGNEQDYDEQARIFKETLDETGASVENAASTIAEIMLSDRLSAQSRLRAAELVLDLHGSRNKDGQINKTPVFNFIVNDTRVNINQIFAPHRSRTFNELNGNDQVIDITPE